MLQLTQSPAALLLKGGREQVKNLSKKRKEKKITRMVVMGTNGIQAQTCGIASNILHLHLREIIRIPASMFRNVV